MEKKNKLSPEDKLMKAIYGNNFKTDAEIEAVVNKISDEDYKQMTGRDIKDDVDNIMLYVRAMKRKDELSEMVENLSKDKYFPNENYRDVFKRTLMQAAQWQYEELMKDIPKWKKVNDTAIRFNSSKAIILRGDEVVIDDFAKHGEYYLYPSDLRFYLEEED